MEWYWIVLIFWVISAFSYWLYFLYNNRKNIGEIPIFEVLLIGFTIGWIVVPIVFPFELAKSIGIFVAEIILYIKK